MEDVLRSLEESLVTYKQKDFITSEEEKLDVLLISCVKLLKFNGYKVTNPRLGTSTHTTFKGLLELFNGHLAISYGPSSVHYTDGRMDIVAIKNFVNSRIKTTGLGPKAAKQECALIIETIFDNLKSFGFKTAPRAGILSAKKCGWVIEKALSIINDKDTKDDEKVYQQLIEDGGDDYLLGNGLLDLDKL